MKKEISTKSVTIMMKPSEFAQLKQEQKDFGLRTFAKYIKKILERRRELFKTKKTI